jgi:hypothetical protein
MAGKHAKQLKHIGKHAHAYLLTVLTIHPYFFTGGNHNVGSFSDNLGLGRA